MDELYTPGRQTAAQQALNIPELVEYIIEQCVLIAEQEGQVIRWQRQTEKRRSRGLRQRRDAIFQCLLVNRTWNAIGSRFLWEFFPKPQAFHNLTLARRQHFANMVRVTQVGYTFPRSSKTISEQILGVDKFPSLVTLDFATGLSDPSSQRLYRALFQPRLQHLRFKGPMMNGSRVLLVDELFPLLQRSCPDLISFELECRWSSEKPPSERDVLEFLVSMPRIMSIALPRLEPAYGYSMLLAQHLAARPKLRFFKLRDREFVLQYNDLSKNVLSFVPKTPGVVFADLESLTLRCDIDWSICAAFLPHLQKLRYLDMSCCFQFSTDDLSTLPQRDIYEWILARLPASPYLEHLALHIFVWQQRRPGDSVSPLFGISGSALVRLAEKRCKLRVLKLSVHRSVRDVSKILDGDIDSMASLLPNLMVLKLGLKLGLKLSPSLRRQKLTTQCLYSLAKHCPGIKECEFPVDLDIFLLTLNRPCLFPSLHYFAMRLQPEKNWSGVDILQLKALLEHHFPRLTSLAGFCGKRWPYTMVSVRSPWTMQKLHRFVSSIDEEDDGHSDWSTVT